MRFATEVRPQLGAVRLFLLNNVIPHTGLHVLEEMTKNILYCLPRW